MAALGENIDEEFLQNCVYSKMNPSVKECARISPYSRRHMKSKYETAVDACGFHPQWKSQVNSVAAVFQKEFVIDDSLASGVKLKENLAIRFLSQVLVSLKWEIFQPSKSMFRNMLSTNLHLISQNRLDTDFAEWCYVAIKRITGNCLASNIARHVLYCFVDTFLMSTGFLTINLDNGRCLKHVDVKLFDAAITSLEQFTMEQKCVFTKWISGFLE